MTAAQPKLTVVVMTYNEAATLRATVDEIRGVIDAMGVTHEILIVDDGSNDGSGPLADVLAATTSNVRVVHHGINRGLGGVYRTGFVEARGELLTFFPADGQFPAQIIADFYPLTRDAEVVLGYLPEWHGSTVGRALALAERLLLRLLFGSFPRFQGILMFRRSLLDNMQLTSTGRGWTVLMEFVLRACRSGVRVVNQPTPLRARSSGKSKVHDLRTVMANLRQVLELRRNL